ncbi:MAG: class I SAM-dependent methyltransferase [Parachlamydiales bacterium]|jgi:SAM-dependent methyltransferase
MKNSSNAPYSNFALPYSLTSEAYFSEKMADLILNITSSSGLKIKHIIDLACGVGTACLYFSNKGYEVMGVDISKNMLDEAEKKAKKMGYNIDWVQQNMKDLSVIRKADLVTCMYDSINFMQNNDELFHVFKKVFDSINHKGLFVFDMYTILGLGTCWGNQDQIHTDIPGHFIATKTTWDSKTKIATKTFHGFMQINEDWKRWEEKHVMSAFQLDEIKDGLTQSGFSSISIYGIDGFHLSDVSDSTKRILIVAGKGK